MHSLPNCCWCALCKIWPHPCHSLAQSVHHLIARAQGFLLLTPGSMCNSRSRKTFSIWTPALHKVSLSLKWYKLHAWLTLVFLRNSCWPFWSQPKEAPQWWPLLQLLQRQTQGTPLFSMPVLGLKGWGIINIPSPAIYFSIKMRAKGWIRLWEIYGVLNPDS